MSVQAPERITAHQEILGELQNATEKAAMAVGPWIAKGNKNAADHAAVDSLLTSFSRSGLLKVHVAIGEGVKDEAPHLPHGEILGGGDQVFDLAVDPVEGTTRVSKGRPGGMVIAALAPHGKFPVWSNVRYMKKLVVGPRAANHMKPGGYVNLLNDPKQNMLEVAAALKKSPEDLRVATLDRPDRNGDIMEAARSLGADVLIPLDSGDVLPALQTLFQNQGVDMLYSSGGSPEAVITAAAVAGFGGNMQAKWDPRSDDERQRLANLSTRDQVLQLHDLIGAPSAQIDYQDVFFSASAITANPLMREVHYNPANKLWERGGSIAIHGFARDIDVQ